jgi:starch phosphorylase
MVRHTLATLGPKVLASRQVADYVTELYLPAARAGWATTPEVAKDLARFKTRIRSAWPQVRVEHVESLGVGDNVQVGDELLIRAFVSIDGLSPDDVLVEAVHGKVSVSDTLTDATVQPLQLVEGYESGRYRFEGTVKLRRTGPFGYNVRILPRHAGVASAAEFGLVTSA